MTLLSFRPFEISYRALGELCAYCKKDVGDTWDHITPRSCGGADSYENLVPCCFHCNAEKGTKTKFPYAVKRFRKFRDRPLNYAIKGKIARAGSGYVFISDHGEHIDLTEAEYLNRTYRTLRLKSARASYQYKNSGTWAAEAIRSEYKNRPKKHFPASRRNKSVG